MTNQETQSSMLIDPEKIKVANNAISDDLKSMYLKSEAEVKKIRLKLSASYWILIALSIFMFSLGFVLLLVPMIAAFSNNIDKLQSIISAGFGIADIATMFLYGPIEKIHKNMGDISQINIALNSYRTQVGLRLWEMDVNNRASIGEAAKNINEAAEKSIKTIQEYFEKEKEEK